MHEAGRDCFSGASVAEVDGVAGCVGVGVCSVAELTRKVEAPTCSGSVVEDCACVVGPGCDCFSGASVAEVDGVAGCVGVGVCSVAELTRKVEAPTCSGSVVEDCACVVGPGCDCFSGASVAEVDGVAGCVGVGVCSVAELTIFIVAPAFDGAVVEDDA